jgi:hypothetical protein
MFKLSFLTWILFILFFAVLIHQNRIRKSVMFKIRKRKDLMTMTNDIIKKYIGKNCKINTGTFGTTVIGKIVEVKENWIEVETKKGNELINSDFVQSIKIK